MMNDLQILPACGEGNHAVVEGELRTRSILTPPSVTPAARHLPASVEDREAGFAPLRRSAENGFTLVEVMVVLVIIGLLTAIVAFNVLPQQDKAMAGKAKADIANIDSALEMYKLNNLTFPTGGEGLAALVSKGVIKKLPNDPWGRPYKYENPGRRGEVDVYSLGADGIEGGEEDNADIGNWQ
jgi:general secretion pathway protein G